MKEDHPPTLALKAAGRLVLAATPLFIFFAAATAAHAASRDAPPAAPALSMAIEAGNTLRFNWKPVPRALYYRLMMDRQGTSRFAVVADKLHATSATIQAPPRGLLDDNEPYYRVDACNDGGCTPSNLLSQGMVEMLEAPATPEFEKALQDLLDSGKPATK